MNVISELIAVAEHDRIFPLQTLSSMAERWGVTRQAVQWHSKQADFPKPLPIIEGHNVRVFALCDVEAYEKVNVFGKAEKRLKRAERQLKRRG